jgi:hypothetical protein
MTRDWEEAAIEPGRMAAAGGCPAAGGWGFEGRFARVWLTRAVSVGLTPHGWSRRECALLSHAWCDPTIIPVAHDLECAAANFSTRSACLVYALRVSLGMSALQTYKYW